MRIPSNLSAFGRQLAALLSGVRILARKTCADGRLPRVWLYGACRTVPVETVMGEPAARMDEKGFASCIWAH